MNQKTMYGYCRVSTVKQGEGTSLVEQKDSIERYALKHDFRIVAWFEEKETAAKRGRPKFSEMLALLEEKKADGVIIHKIDRSARNLRDWVVLGELVDLGVDVHFSHETVDFSSRSGRLAADIRALFAVDYSRNLSDETKKGQRGRLKQGVYPWGAPLGYLNTGRGNLKKIDPERGHLIKEMFETYATGLYTLNQLSNLMRERGLRNNQGSKVTKKRISEIFKNPFYIGILQNRKNGETFAGKHPPLVSTDIYQQVQSVLAGKRHPSLTRHDFLYRKCIKCDLCNLSLTAEKQKGHVYYRCRTIDCPTKTVREELIGLSIDKFIQSSTITDKVIKDIADHYKIQSSADVKKVADAVNGAKAQSALISKKLERLTEKFAEDLIDQSTYERVRKKFLVQSKECDEKIDQLKASKPPCAKEIKQLLTKLNLAKHWNAREGHQDKRHLLKVLLSKLSYSNGKISLELNEPYNVISQFALFPTCCHDNSTVRTSRQIISFIVTVKRSGQMQCIPDRKIQPLDKLKHPEIIRLFQRHDVLQTLKSAVIPAS